MPRRAIKCNNHIKLRLFSYSRRASYCVTLHHFEIFCASKTTLLPIFRARAPPTPPAPPHSVSKRSPECLPRHRRRPVFAPASRRAREAHTAETSVGSQSEYFDPALPARAASLAVSSRRVTPANDRSESSPAARGERVSLDAKRCCVFLERVPIQAKTGGERGKHTRGCVRVRRCA